MFENLIAMVVDKSPAMEKILSSILLDQLSFNQVISAHSATDAARLINSGAKVDIIVSSWEFADSTAEDLLKQIRPKQRGQYIPFILMTKDTSETFLVKAFKAGVTEYIEKPFKPEDLTRAIMAVAVTKGSERRQAVRYKAKERNKVVISIGKTASYSGTLIDLSTGGMMVKTSQFLQNPVNIYDSAHITFYVNQKPVEMKAEIRRMEPDINSLPDKTIIRVAFMFTNVDSGNMQRLLDFIETLKADIPDVVGME
ncbi:MAG: response regulator [Nitrospinota bacterium]|nr:response regulator [Nitrospinota bacterium]MDH5678707.1 response regulator [Nitrospinota bacterium]MDH5757112.1 response regulator [Nitrospinota bacterium]